MIQIDSHGSEAQFSAGEEEFVLTLVTGDKRCRSWREKLDLVLVLPSVSGLDTELRIIHDVVAVDGRRHEPRCYVQAVEVKISAIGIAQMLRGFAAGWIGRQLIDHLNSESVPDIDAQRRSRDAVIHAAQRHRLVVEHRPAIRESQGDIQLSVGRRQGCRFNEGFDRLADGASVRQILLPAGAGVSSSTAGGGSAVGTLRRGRSRAR